MKNLKTVALAVLVLSQCSPGFAQTAPKKHIWNSGHKGATAVLAPGEPAYCVAIKPIDKPTPDCRYPINQSSDLKTWSRPSDAEWSRDSVGARSGYVNVYIHGDINKVMAALKTSDWKVTMVNDGKDNALYVGSAGVDLFYDLKDKAIKDSKTLQHYYVTRPTNEQRSDHNKNIVDNVVSKMPVSKEYLCGQLQLVAYEFDNVIWSGRHHFRIWDTGLTDQPRNQGNHVYAIAGNHDTGIVFQADRCDKPSVCMNHAIDPNTDGERDEIVSTLESLGIVDHIEKFGVDFPCPAPVDGARSSDKTAVDVFLK